MSVLELSADELISALMSLSASERVCILDSCGIGHLGSHLLIAGLEPVEVIEISNKDTDQTLQILDQKLTGDLAAIFTLSYDLGRKMLNIGNRESVTESLEPDAYVACFDVLVIHDYDTGITELAGNSAKFGSITTNLLSAISNLRFEISNERDGWDGQGLDVIRITLRNHLQFRGEPNSDESGYNATFTRDRVKCK